MVSKYWIMLKFYIASLPKDTVNKTIWINVASQLRVCKNMMDERISSKFKQQEKY